MQQLLTVITSLGLAAVVVVLALGLINMFRGGSPSTSQMLMRWRVVLQLLAIVLVLVAVYVLRG